MFRPEFKIPLLKYDFWNFWSKNFSQKLILNSGAAYNDCSPADAICGTSDGINFLCECPEHMNYFEETVPAYTLGGETLTTRCELKTGTSWAFLFNMKMF